ncbi:MAG: hypothetical protein M1834_003432 [Cirrosporium novae-zelandiae]|nr:MAG: hypothetical protein M1834_003432 [Cirrosporium novae-zelandiae]
MREVNFSIPNANKASVGITTALYDRRALDCTSTLPLINSLNHLAYLTTSSARIREILTIDGGVERLVCILKDGRKKDPMDLWKWNLAFQCVVNIGVRGSETIRTRVVEADMVPVIATMLDNYIRLVDKCREKAEARVRSNAIRLGGSKASSRNHEHTNRSSFLDRTPGHNDNRHFRRQAPPPSIEIPHPYPESQPSTDSVTTESTPTVQLALTSPPEQVSFSRNHHPIHRVDNRQTALSRSGLQRHALPQPLATAVPSMDRADGFVLRPVRDTERLPSMIPGLQTGVASRPESPITPSIDLSAPRISNLEGRPRRRPSIRHQQSTSGDSDDGNGEEMVASDDQASTSVTNPEPIVDIQTTVDVQTVDDRDPLDGSSTPINPSDTQVAETFNITHRSSLDGSTVHATAAVQENTTIPWAPPQPIINTLGQASPLTHSGFYPRFLDQSVPASVFAAMPRDEDVLMSLQLLAYVSKYCYLRTYFQRSHLVPKLKISSELQKLEENQAEASSAMEDQEEEEYLQPDDFNIFPLVEKFTVRHHSKDMQYWAGVVMRNLCRKDDTRGGIRQCAYYQCGKWEEYTRQFAKCRRCRRTKYCSKECQKSAWVYHRHWCVAADKQQT